MGPTNVALVTLSRADQQLRESQGRLDAATKNVRIQERRANDLAARVQQVHQKLKEDQARAGNLDLDLRSRDAHIEKLRTQQQVAKTNKEYQAFLIEINTQKLDKGKVEDEAMRAMEAVEKGQNELKELTAQLEGERTKLATMKAEIGDRIAQLQVEIDALKPAREEAAKSVPPRALQEFERLADRYEGEALAAIARPDRRREEYLCTACNMDLVTDVYNRLHSRDEIVFCPSCRRMLYIPEELPIEAAVNKVKEKKARAVKAPPAGVNRQTSAVDVLRSMTPDEEEGAEAPETQAAAPAPDVAAPPPAAAPEQQQQQPATEPQQQQ